MPNVIVLGIICAGMIATFVIGVHVGIEKERLRTTQRTSDSEKGNEDV